MNIKSHVKPMLLSFMSATLLNACQVVKPNIL